MSDFYGDMQDETDVWVILGELSCFQKIDMTLSFYVIPLNFRRPNIIFFLPIIVIITFAEDIP